jgi:hypothetical protein
MKKGMNRTSVGVLALFAVACAGQPRQHTTSTQPSPAPVATQYISPTGQKLAQMPVSGDARTDEQRLSEAKKAGFKLVNTNGEQLFCRTDPKIGSRVQKETTCLTAKQLDDLHDQTRLGLSQRIANPPPSLSGR